MNHIIAPLIIAIIILYIVDNISALGKRQRHAVRDFASAYDAYKRASRDPHTLDASGLESWLHRSHQNLKSIKP
jgi:hypothetical protein